MLIPPRDRPSQTSKDIQIRPSRCIMASMRVRRAPTVVLALSGVLCLFALPARGSAQSEEEIAHARETFRQGIELSDQRRWEEAEARFREVLAVRSAPPVVFNLAVVLQQQGEYPEAGSLLEGLLADAEVSNDIKVACQELLGKMNSTGGKLAVELSGASEGATVVLDGYELASSDLGRSYWLREGTHRVEVQREGAPPLTQDVEVEAGLRRVLQIHLVPTPADAARGAVSAGGPSADFVKDWRFWAVAGGAVAAVAVIIVIVAVAASPPPSFQGNFEPGGLVFP